MKERYFNVLKGLAKEYSLTLTAWDKEYTPEASKGQIIVSSAYDPGLDPAPISPTDVSVAGWKLFAGTNRGMWASRPEVSQDGSVVDLPEGEDLVMAPFMSSGVSLD